MQRFYGEPKDEVRPIINVVLDALERDEYRIVLEQIDAAQHHDVSVLASALAEFGVLEIGRIAQQAQHRLRFLDELEKLVTNPDTKEAVVHTALATNLWVFGAEFSLVVSNTIRRNRTNAAERLGFIGRVMHGRNPRTWLRELRAKIGEPVDYSLV